jgi:glycosyltransferase involved in cell wall biosynthesis
LHIADSPAGPGFRPIQADPTDQTALTNAKLLSLLGVVVIGRNEGERLERCLHSVEELTQNVVYVDSGSTDESVALGRMMTAAVVELDLNSPFTAARARNAGFEKLLEMRPGLDYVFFVDGDCEVEKDWLTKASNFLCQHERVAVAWGLRRERYPDKSIYNLLCAYEWWDIASGETKNCGGDALIRVSAFKQVQGYRPELICGEEPEMCVRLRKLGWQIWRLSAPMTIHDAAMFHFRQWWTRMLRGGYGFAQGAALHGKGADRHGVPETLRAWLWGFFIPIISLLLAFVFGWPGLILLAIYPIQIARLAINGKRSARENWLRAAALVVGKFAEMLGQMKYLTDRVRKVTPRLIEYK